MLVVGGGVGGLCSAIALRRRGVAVDVVELNPKWDTYGVGIIQPGNALRALGELGLAERCVAEGFGMPGHQYHDRNGNPVQPPFDHPLPPGSRGPAMNGITRPRLHRILQQAALESGALVRTGVSVASLEQDDDGVSVACTDGSRERYDLVLGADGINSQIRSLVIGERPAPEYIGQVCWRYNLPRLPELTRFNMYIGSRGKAGLVPLSDELMYLLLIEKPPDGAPVKLPSAALALTFRERLAEFGGPIGELRERLVEDSEVVYRPVESIILPDPWYRGRVLLIGDAAHATSPHVGQGAAQAIEDAVVIAEEVERGGGVTAVLERFMARRYERCRLVVEGSLQISRWEQEPTADADDVAMVARITEAVSAPL